jgi:SAM-dependent methyltransferase
VCQGHRREEADISSDREKTREKYRQFHERRHKALIELLTTHVPEKRTRCLDIGGGEDVAEFAPFIQERFAEELHTVDLAADLERLRSEGIHPAICNVDQAPLPYEDGFFDIVLFASVIEHLYNPHFALGEMTRTLAPGGILLLEAPNALALGRRIDALLGRNPFARFNQYNALEGKALMEYCSVFYTVEEIEALLAPGFTIEEHRYGMHSPSLGFAKRLVRESAFVLNPRMADCFFVVARKKG